MSALLAFASGLIFALGLIAGGMTQPAKVKGFLDFFGPWDPSLAFVMGGGIAVGVVAFWLAKKRVRSWSGLGMEMPGSNLIDTRLVAGGILFGSGWGLGGFCPGPGLVALAAGFGDGFVFVGAMIAGMLIHDVVFVTRPPAMRPSETHP